MLHLRKCNIPECVIRLKKQKIFSHRTQKKNAKKAKPSFTKRNFRAIIWKVGTNLQNSIDIFENLLYNELTASRLARFIRRYASDRS